MRADRAEDATAKLDQVALLSAQLEHVHRRLESSFSDWLGTLEPASALPGSQPVAVYVHAATVEDVALHTLLLGRPPLFATTWAGRGPSQYSIGELAPVRSYAHDVFAAGDAYLAGLTGEAASQRVDLSRLHEGHPTVAWVVSRFMVLELAQLCGELVSALRASKAST